MQLPVNIHITHTHTHTYTDITQRIIANSKKVFHYGSHTMRQIQMLKKREYKRDEVGKEGDRGGGER